MTGLVEQSEENPGSWVPPRDGHGAPKLGGRAPSGRSAVRSGLLSRPTAQHGKLQCLEVRAWVPDERFCRSCDKLRDFLHPNTRHNLQGWGGRSGAEPP